MGIKMSVAIDAAGTPWRAETYTKGQGKDPLKCEKCPALIHHKVAHPRERDSESTIIPAHFALNPLERHASNCKYAVDQEIKIIARESEKLIETISNGKYRLRLVMFRDAFNAHQPAISGRGTKTSTNQKSTTYERASGEKLAGYINTAKRILELRAICDNDNEIAEHLELLFEDNTIIPWSQFYFETEQHLNAFYAVLHNTVQHPFAMHGTVKSKQSYKNKFIINLEKPRYLKDSEDGENGIGIDVSIWTENENWLNGIEVGSEVVIFGPWRATSGIKEPAKKQRGFNTYLTNKLRLTLKVPSQIIRVPN